MATILYGVNGEGAGHSTRSREVILHLVRSGHQVHVASFDRGLQNLSADFDVTEIFGFRFAYVNNRVRYNRTVAKNLLTAPKAARSSHHLLQLAEQWNVDLVITDFEPLTCHVAHRLKLPVITIDNQHCLTNTDVTYPREFRRDAAAAKIVCRSMTPRVNASLVTSFFSAKPRKPNTYLFPPILRQEILSAKPTDGDHILVYVTSPAPALLKTLAGVRANFVAYGFGREGREGNITFKKPDAKGFLADLVSANAIVANAGFSLVTEALHLGKPYLAVPVAHQFEQVFNAYWLARMQYGAWWNELNKERVESFLFNLPLYREQLRSYPRQGNDALFAKLDELITQFTHAETRAARV